MNLYKKLLLTASFLLWMSLPTASYAALGDILVGSANPSINTRLTIGATNTVMLSTGSIPSWVATSSLGISGGSGSGVPSTTPFTSGYIPYATSTLSLTNSNIFQLGSNVGIGTVSPGSILALGGTAARIFGMDRNTTAATAGQGFTISSGGAIAGTSNLAGGDLTLKSGISTGTGSSTIHFYTATAGGSATTDRTPTEKMTILGSGNVGIGTVSPADLLQVGLNSGGNASVHLVGGTSGVPSSLAQVELYGGSTHWGTFNSDNNTGKVVIGNVQPYPFALVTNNTDRLTIDGSGNVGIGTTTPAQKLDVNGYITTESVISCNGATSALGTDTTGKIYCNTTLSDQSVKTNLSVLSPQSVLNQLMKLKPLTYNWSDAYATSTQGRDQNISTSTEQVGLIAQQVQALGSPFSDAVSTTTIIMRYKTILTAATSTSSITSTSTDDQGNEISTTTPVYTPYMAPSTVPVYKQELTIDYSKLTPMLVAALQAEQAEIAAINARLTAAGIK